MPSRFFQELQSCLEARLVEARVLRLKLALSKANSFGNSLDSASSNEETKSSRSLDKGGWSFLQSLSQTKDSSETEHVYVHPLVKRSSSVLSQQSLEMCTESLGSETGSESSDDPMVSLENGCLVNPSKTREHLDRKRMSRSTSFPPPLTSMSGSVGVQVRPHREGGRLILQAVPVPSPNSCFHAERGDGRLRLSLMVNPIKEQDQEEVAEEEEEEENSAEEADEEEEDMEGKKGHVGGTMGRGKLTRPSRCKEGGRGHESLFDCELWVAT